MKCDQHPEAPRKEPRRIASKRTVKQNATEYDKAGNALEELLTSHGITKEWYMEIKQKFGLPPKCSCEARQEWLNKVSAAHPTIASVGVKLLNALTRK